MTTATYEQYVAWAGASKTPITPYTRRQWERCGEQHKRLITLAMRKAGHA